MMKRKNADRPFSFPINTLAGSSFANLTTIQKDYQIDPAYRKKFILSALVSLILEPFRIFENIVYERRIRRFRIEKPPIFIIGFWRSGTTLMHSLLCKASDAAYVTTFQTVFPHVTLTQSFWLKPMAKLLMPLRRPVDNVKMGLDFPQEEEIALANICKESFYHFYFFPKNFDQIYKNGLFLDEQNERVIGKWKSDYLRLVKKAMMNTKGSRLISKSPSNMVRIPLLLELFPDAKFIYIYRNPYHTIDSTISFFNAIMPTLQLQQIDQSTVAGNIVRLYKECTERYNLDKIKLPSNQLIEVRFEDFEKDKLGGLKKIYDQLELPGFEDELPAFRSYLNELEDFKMRERNIPDEHVKLVNSNLVNFLSLWGYEKI